MKHQIGNTVLFYNSKNPLLAKVISIQLDGYYWVKMENGMIRKVHQDALGKLPTKPKLPV